jgi:hypothetical protein
MGLDPTANLRKTSTKMNQLIENTPAGQLAREAKIVHILTECEKDNLFF